MPAAPGLSGGKHTTSTTHLKQSQGILTNTEVIQSTKYLLRLKVRQSIVPAYDSRHLSLDTESDANYTITASLKIKFALACIMYIKRGEFMSSSQKDTFPKAPWPER